MTQNAIVDGQGLGRKARAEPGATAKPPEGWDGKPRRSHSGATAEPLAEPLKTTKKHSGATENAFFRSSEIRPWLRQGGDKEAWQGVLLESFWGILF